MKKIKTIFILIVLVTAMLMPSGIIMADTPDDYDISLQKEEKEEEDEEHNPDIEIPGRR